MEYKSQHKQDEFIVNYFKEKRNGVFVDIGAHDGITLSNTYILEKEYGDAIFEVNTKTASGTELPRFPLTVIFIARLLHNFVKLTVVLAFT